MTFNATRWDVGTEFEVEVGPIAHGGHCVARYEGRVVFVRHTLPGERVRVRITEDTGGSFCRADAVRIIEQAPDRVQAPCPYAKPGGCGGCDFQHVDPSTQREFKRAIITEQLARVGGFSSDEIDALGIEVQELPGGSLGWRTRTRFLADDDGVLGMRKHRSHDIVPVDRCAIAVDAINDADELHMRWEPETEVSFVAGSDDVAVLAEIPGGKRPTVHRISGPERLNEQAAEYHWQVRAAGFWQVHPAAAETLVREVLAAINPAPGQRILDLYSGAGLFSLPLADAVGPAGEIISVESERAAVADARRHVRGKKWVRAEVGQVHGFLNSLSVKKVDAVVLDPPRAGAGKMVVKQIAKLKPQLVAYVSCDPATLARDLKQFRALGYVLTDLLAFDAFPMTHHVECLATLSRRDSE
ncbi:MAG: class I SAM-dependent RNA methyltransferase [Corynebacteriales bacterium]|nr:class I SAM-dependent RNA methyltransferase [Mycobacteriales bacterium]